MNHIIVADHCTFNKDAMPDVQNVSKAFHPIPIKKVGIRNLELPIVLLNGANREPGIDCFREAKATFSAYVDLTEESRGINMSRLGRTIVEVLNISKYSSSIADHTVQALSEKIVKQLKEANKSSTAYLKVKFNYPYETVIYASKLNTTEYVDVVWEAVIDEKNEISHIITVEIVGLSLCPCSKEMSLLVNNLDPKEKEMFEKFKKEGNDLWPTMKSFIQKIERAGFGAHNQRSKVSITIIPQSSTLVWFEDLIDIANKSFSAPIRNILKREDEKVEGEMGYLGGYYAEDASTGCVTFNSVEGTGPKFVEDIARDAAKQLDDMLDKTIDDYLVTVLNAESIHSRDLEAVAVLTAGRQLQ